jgi:outer membrane receptor protein involved in Fe transport
LILGAAFSGALMAQSTLASITGVATDANGAILSGVKIEATNIATNYKYRATSNDSGQYTVTGLLNGVYTLRATLPGFADFVAEKIVLVEREERRLDVELKLGTVQTKIEVNASPQLIETETARVSDVKEHEIMWIAPLFLHRTADIIAMAPLSTYNAYGYRVGGGRNHESEMSYDGISGASATGGTVNGVTVDRTEAIQEVRVEAAGNNAEFNTVGQLSLVSRAGTNQVHGSAFDVYITPGWSARNPFALTNTANLQHQPGGSLGGPVYIPKVYDGRNKTFFYATIEFERFGGASPTIFAPTVPLASWRTGDFSGLLPATPVKDPFNNSAPFPGNIVPASRLNPVAVAIQNQLYPLPNYGDTSVLQAGNFRNLTYYPLPTNPTGTLRMDHKFSDKAWIYGRITKVYWDISGPSGTVPTYGFQHRYRYDNVYGLAFTYMITPTLVSESRYGYSSDNLPLWGPLDGLQNAQQLGLTGLAPNIPSGITGSYGVNWSGIGLATLGTGYQCNPCNLDPAHNGQESLSWFHGRHSVKGGLQVRRNDYEYYSPSVNLFGTDTFSSRFTGFAYSDFLLGIPTTAARAFPPLKQTLMEYTYSLFVQDEFRVTPKLTVNYGLRYEYKAPWTEANGYLSVFDPKTGKIAVPDSALSKVSPLMPTNLIGVISASQAGYPTNLINGYKKGFAPRLGLAWRPLDNNTVFRGGFGMYYDNYMDHPTATGVPFLVSEPAYTNPSPNPTLILPNVFPTTGNAVTSVSPPAAYNPNLRVPYSIQYNAAIERQFGHTAVSLSFVTTGSREITYYYDLNQPLPSTTPYINAPRPFPNLPNIPYYTNGAGHEYRAGTLQVKHSFTNGLWFQAYYTLARDIGDIDIDGSVENAFNRRRDVGVWSNPPTNRFYANMIYDLPVGKGKRFLPNAGRWLNTIFGGWQLANIFVREGGFFLTPQWTGPDPTNTRYTTSSTPPTVTLRPNILSNPNLSDPTVGRWYNTAAFAAPSPGAFGTSAPGVIIGPPLSMLSSTMKKYFSIRERAQLRLEFLAVNTLNHLGYLSTPDVTVTNLATAGTITAASPNRDGGQPRQVQVIVRVEW